MKKAAVYMRVSTQNQEEEQTIENQYIELVQRIKEDGNLLLPENEYRDDGWSGTILERPSLDRMRADGADGKFEVLYFYDRGRVSRKFLHQEIILEALREDGIECISLHDINGVTDEERLMGGVMGIFAEYERIKLVERMRIGKYRKVHERKMLLGYNPKYGYIYHHRIKSGPNSQDASFTVNKNQAEVVNMIFEWAAQGMSKYSIRTELFNHGVQPPKGKSNVWSTGVIDRMLVDSTYMGDHCYNKSESVITKNPRRVTKYKRVLKGSRVKRPAHEWMHIEVPAIITPELFYTVQERLRKNKRARSNNKKHDYLVGGLIDCVCGQARTGDPANGCLYYRCNDRLNHPLGTRKCFEKSVNATVLDDVVWRNVKRLLTNPRLVMQYAQKWGDGVSPLQNRLERSKNQLNNLVEKESRIAQAYTDGIMSEDIYRKKYEEISGTRTHLFNEIRVIENELASKPTIPLEQLVNGVLKLVGELDFSDRRYIIQQVVDKVEATQKEIKVCGFIPVLATGEIGSNGQYSDSQFSIRVNKNGSSEIGLNGSNRYRRLAKCRQINPIQRPNSGGYFGS